MTDDAVAGPATPLAELRGITKQFPGVLANDGADFRVVGGSVHGLLGENGAGKSTLMSILCGLYQPDAGSILVDGRPVKVRSPRDAAALGLGIVQQHFALVPNLTVAENVILGVEGSAVLRPREILARVQELCSRYHLDLDAAATVGDLSVGQRQRVELAKTLIRSRRVLVLDEPTTVLTQAEVGQLFDTLRSIASVGGGVVIITHKLDELLAVCDDITVMRAGRTLATHRVGDTSAAELATEMVGRAVAVPWLAATLGVTEERGEKVAPREAPGAAAPVRLSLRALSVRDRHGVLRLNEASVDVGEGEIVGIAGVEGNGQRELVGVLAGIVPLASGRVLVDGTEVGLDWRGLRSAGIRAVTEDRHQSGVILDMTLLENLICDRLTDPELVRAKVIRRREAARLADRLVADYEIKAPHCHAPMRNLSGGNQQRAVLARELSSPTTVLVAAQPTRGLDIGATADVVERILQARDAGAAVLYVSSDLAELRALCDRIAVLNGGSLTEARPTASATSEWLGAAMSGVSQ